MKSLSRLSHQVSWRKAISEQFLELISLECSVAQRGTRWVFKQTRKDKDMAKWAAAVALKTNLVII